MSVTVSDIRGRLVLDDAASAALEKIASGLGVVERRVNKTGGELASFAKKTAATALGFQFDRGLESVKQIASEAIDAAKEAGKQQKELAGILTITDKTGVSYNELKKQAGGLKDELEVMGIEAGVSSDQMIDMFGDIAARSSKTNDQIKELLNTMANVGKIVPGGMQAVASGMMQLEMGIARARNPVVQLIASSGILADHLKKTHMNAKEVAAYLGKLKPSSQLELADRALTKMNDKVKDVPMSWAQVSQSMKDVREQLFEHLGMPLLDAIRPTKALKEARDWLKDHQDEMEKAARAVGEKFASWMKQGITEAVKLLRTGFAWTKAHADDIKNAIEKAAETLKAATAFVIDHKDAIAALLAIRYAQKEGGKFVEKATAYGETAGKAGSAVWSAVKQGAPMFGLGKAPSNAEAFATFAVAVAAFAAAVAAWTAASNQWEKLLDENKTIGHGGAEKLDFDARQKTMEQLAAKPTLTEAELSFFDTLQKKQVESARNLGMSAEFVNTSINNLWKEHLETKKDFEAFQDVAKKAETSSGWTQLNDPKTGWQGTGEKVEEVNTATEEWVELYNRALRRNNKALIDTAISEMAKLEDLQGGLLLGKFTLEQGYDGLINALKEKNKEFAEQLKEKFAKEAKDAASKPMKLEMNHNTFHIKQDFKDNDPDRVAVVFREDIAKAAVFRIGSRLQDPFGL